MCENRTIIIVFDKVIIIIMKCIRLLELYKKQIISRVGQFEGKKIHKRPRHFPNTLYMVSAIFVRKSQILSF